MLVALLLGSYESEESGIPGRLWLHISFKVQPRLRETLSQKQKSKNSRTTCYKTISNCGAIYSNKQTSKISPQKGRRGGSSIKGTEPSTQVKSPQPGTEREGDRSSLVWQKSRDFYTAASRLTYKKPEARTGNPSTPRFQTINRA